jgi:putative transposase
VVKPAARRAAAGSLIQTHGISERRACRILQIHRSVMRYPFQSRNDAPLRERLKSLAAQYPRYGYLMLHALLQREGLVQNRKRTYRVYTELGLQVRTKQRKKLVRARIPMVVPMAPNERWSLDFVSDQLACGRRFRILNVVDDYSRECIGQLVDVSISGARMARYLGELGQARKLPAAIVCDNGTEMTSKAMFFWAKETAVRLDFIQPGKPTQNAFVESFNGKFRDGCLNQHWFRDLKEARHIITDWRKHYNEVRPHSSLGYLPPAVFAQKAA